MNSLPQELIGLIIVRADFNTFYALFRVSRTFHKLSRKVENDILAKFSIKIYDAENGIIFPTICGNTKLLHGQQVYFYQYSSSIRKTIMYNRGLKHGLTEIYFGDRRVSFTYTFINNIPIFVEDYNSDGTLNRLILCDNDISKGLRLYITKSEVTLGYIKNNRAVGMHITITLDKIVWSIKEHNDI